MTEAVLIQESDTSDVEFKVPSRQSPRITGVAENALACGLELCTKRVGLDSLKATVYHMQEGNSIAHAYCCYGIARQIAEYIGLWDKNVKAIYTLDYDAAPEGMCFVYPRDYEATPKGPYPGEWTQDAPLVHLLVWTQHRTTALDSLAAALDRALARVYADTIGTRGLTTLLDVQVIEDTYVEKHVGSGERYNWLYLRPIRLWIR